MPSARASARPCSAAISVDDDVTLIAGSAQPPKAAASSIARYWSVEAMGMGPASARGGGAAIGRAGQRCGDRPRAGASAVEVAQHREYAAMVLAGLLQPQLVEDARDVPLDRRRGDDERVGDPAVRAALGHQRDDVPFTWREVVERAVVALAADHARDDL